jgi:3-oxoacyl-[acyl-carrier protein] reductase
MSTLNGKVALVTGASRGIGRAIAERFAQDGAAVVINCSSSLAQAEEVANTIKANGGSAIAIKANIGDVAQVRALVKDTVNQLGRLDILVNNAAIHDPTKPALEITEEEFDRSFALNVRGAFFVMQKAARIMPEGGRIINISTIGTSVGFPNYSVYVASKSALEGFTLVMASELAPLGITVNTVSPGTTETVMLEKLLSENPDGMEAMFVQRTPMGRIGQPPEIADVVAFLASEDARWVTGQNLRVDGGFR